MNIATPQPSQSRGGDSRTFFSAWGAVSGGRSWVNKVQELSHFPVFYLKLHCDRLPASHFKMKEITEISVDTAERTQTEHSVKSLHRGHLAGWGWGRGCGVPLT